MIAVGKKTDTVFPLVKIDISSKADLVHMCEGRLETGPLTGRTEKQEKTRKNQGISEAGSSN